jgi:hypothetical protein
MAGARFNIRAVSLTSFVPGGPDDDATGSAGLSVVLVATSVT